MPFKEITMTFVIFAFSKGVKMRRSLDKLRRRKNFIFL